MGRWNRSLKQVDKMPSIQEASKIFEEIADLFASSPAADVVLSFRPSDSVVQRASELLGLSRTGQLDDELRHELDQYEQAEMLMRLVKARIRARRQESVEA